MSVPGDDSPLHIKDFQILGTVPQIRALAREERLQMIGLLTPKPLTATMVARSLGISPNRANYHIKQLLRHGLVTEVATGRKRWKEERFYQATARHFLMDPRLTCKHGETSHALMQSAEETFLDWRRTEILSIDLGEVARRIVQECLAVKAGERVLVLFVPQGLELAEAVLVELETIHASPILKTWSRNWVFRTLDRNAPASLRRMPFMEPDVDDRLDAVILITGALPQGSPPNEEQRKKLPILLESLSLWQRSLRTRGVRLLEFAIAHRGEFEGGTMTVEEAIDIYWRCLRTDHILLRKRAQRVLSRIGQNRSLTILGPRGEKLELELDPGGLRINDGIISKDDLAAGNTSEYLPAGTLFCLPVSTSATGTLSADYTYVAGNHFRNVRASLRSGRIEEIDCDNDSKRLREVIFRESGDATLFAGISFGLNPAGRGHTGKPSLDSCLEGVVALCFGNNELQGGSVKSTLDLTLPSESLTVRAGDRVVVDKGELLVD